MWTGSRYSNRRSWGFQATPLSVSGLESCLHHKFQKQQIGPGAATCGGCHPCQLAARVSCKLPDSTDVNKPSSLALQLDLLRKRGAEPTFGDGEVSVSGGLQSQRGPLRTRPLFKAQTVSTPQLVDLLEFNPKRVKSSRVER